MIRFLILSNKHGLRDAMASGLYSKEELVTLWKLYEVTTRITHLRGHEILTTLQKQLINDLFNGCLDNAVQVLAQDCMGLDDPLREDLMKKLNKFLKQHKDVGIKLSVQDIASLLRQTW